MISQLLRIVNGYLETETATDESLAEQVSRLREVVTVLAARLDQHFNGGMYDHPEFAQEHHTHGHHTHSEFAERYHTHAKHEVY